MKRDKILYWVSTGLVGAGMLMSATMYLTKNEQLINGFEAIHMPLYLVTLLGITKLLGSIALLVPRWNKLKEWAYAGFTFTFLGAVWSHISTGTPFVAPIVFLVLLGTSYLFWSRVRRQNAA